MSIRTMGITRLAIVLFVSGIFLGGCSRSPQPGPDNTILGTAAGAGIGAGAGAIVANQVTNAIGAGIGIGAGFGAVAGALTGATQDFNDIEQLRLERKLLGLKLQNQSTQEQLQALQTKLDTDASHNLPGWIYQVHFDEDATSLRAGAIADMEAIGDLLRISTQAYRILVSGHADDSGTPEYNQQLSEARARSVASYLMSRGISADQIIVKAFGSSRPLASNSTPVGRQMNRRVEVQIAK